MGSSRIPPGLKAVCFDLGDTLISLDRWWPAVCQSFGRAMGEHFDIPLSRRKLADLFQRAHTRTMLRLVESDIEYLEAGMRKSAVKSVLKSFQMKFDQEDVQRIFEAALAEVAGADILFPGAAATVEAVGRRYQVCLLSNGYGPWTRDFLRRQGLEGLFGAVVVSSDLSIQKPDRRIFEEALRRLGREAAETVMIGDYYDTDIRGALAMGMRTIWLNPAGEKPGDGVEPDVTVKTIAEVPHALGLDRSDRDL